MSETENRKTATSIVEIIIAILIIVIIIIFCNGKSNDVVISYNDKVIGLKCNNDTIVHPVLKDYTPIAFTNEITATFQSDKLLSIMFQYEGTYNSAKEVEEAEAFAAADYNKILANVYKEKIDVFSHVFVKDGNKLRLTITGYANDVSLKTAPYFLLDLDESSIFPKQIDAMRVVYEDEGFSCEITE